MSLFRSGSPLTPRQADESLLLAGLALGTRLSAGVPISEASWQLAPRDLNGVYVYAPKDFIGIMNTAVNLLSANQRTHRKPRSAARVDCQVGLIAADKADRTGSRERAGRSTNEP